MIEVIHDDCRAALRRLPDESVDCCVTSPPYWGLRDYGHDKQIGLEATPDEYVAVIVDVFREVRRALKPEGTLWLNLGDSYAANRSGSVSGSSLEGAQSGIDRPRPPARAQPASDLKTKDLCGIPWRVAFALQADGWYLRADIIWAKPNPMPESVQDRPTKAHEYVFLLSKQPRYFYNAEAIKQPAKYRAPNSPQSIKSPYGQGFARRVNKQRGHGRRHEGFNERWNGMTYAEQRALGANARSVWSIATRPYPEAHFATFPEELAKRCILAGCPEGGTVLDPFAGTGTVGAVAEQNGCRAVLIEANSAYLPLIEKRCRQPSLLAAQATAVDGRPVDQSTAPTGQPTEQQPGQHAQAPGASA